MPKSNKKKTIQEYVRFRNWRIIGRQEWEELRQDYSETAIRAALAEIDMPIAQPFAGVGTKTLQDLENSLIGIAEVYARVRSSRLLGRDTVIEAKERTRFAARNPKTPPEKRALKEEMVEWMLVQRTDSYL